MALPSPNLSRIGWRRVYETNVSAAPTALTAGVKTRASIDASTYSAFKLWRGIAAPAIGFSMFFFGATDNATAVATIWAVNGFDKGGEKAPNPYDSTNVLIRKLGVTGTITMGSMAGLDVSVATGGVVITSELFADTIASWTEDATYQTPITSAFGGGTAGIASPANNLIAYLHVPEIGEADSIIVEFTTVGSGTWNAAILPHVSRVAV